MSVMYRIGKPLQCNQLTENTYLAQIHNSGKNKTLLFDIFHLQEPNYLGQGCGGADAYLGKTGGKEVKIHPGWHASRFSHTHLGAIQHSQAAYLYVF